MEFCFPNYYQSETSFMVVSFTSSQESAMSQLMDAPPQQDSDQAVPSEKVQPETQSAAPALHARDENYQAFSYRPTPMSATVALVLGVLSLVVFVSPLAAIPLGTVAALIGLFASIAILRSHGELAGRGFALTGLLLGLGCAASGAVLTQKAYEEELVPGYKRISFTRDIANKKYGFEYQGTTAQLMIHPDVLKLQDKKLLVKGYILQTNRQYALNEFILCRDNSQCCFGGDPPTTDMIQVRMDEITADYIPGLVSVHGKLGFNPNYSGGPNEPLYVMEVELPVKAAATGF